MYFCVEDNTVKRHWKAGYQHKLYFHISQTYLQNNHNTVWRGQESQTKALWKSKLTDITVVASPGAHGQPVLFFLLWPIFIVSDHSTWGGGRYFTGRRQVFQVRNKLTVKSAGKGLSLCVWAAKWVFIATITKACQVSSLQGYSDITVASSACHSGSVGVEYCVAHCVLPSLVMQQLLVTKGYLPTCQKTPFMGIRGNKEKCDLTSKYHPKMKLS